MVLKMTNGEYFLIIIIKMKKGGCAIHKYNKAGKELAHNRLVNSIDFVEQIYIKKGWKHCG